MRQIKKLTWLQACFLGDVGVIWCNSLGDSLFQILCDEFCRLCAYCYSHITSHVSQVFTSFTHYTSYSLLNIVHVIVCIFGLTNQVCKYFEFLCKTDFMLENLWRMFENPNFGKTGFKPYVFEKLCISYSCILPIFSMLGGFYAKTGLFFLEFRLIEAVFQSIEIDSKFLDELLSVSINRN